MNVKKKADHVRASKQDRSHTCHWPGCDKQVPPAKWGCIKHWYALPSSLRLKIWRAYRINQEQDQNPSQKYVGVAREVQNWILENHPSPKRKRKRLRD